MAEKKEKQTAETKLNSFMEKNRKPFIAVFCVVVVALVALVVFEIVKANNVSKNVAAIDSISYELTKDGSDLSEEDVAARCAACLEKVTPYTKKGGIAGIRANLLAGEVSYMTKDYAAAISYYKAAIEKGKKAYTAPIANYNLGSCYEATGDSDSAAAAYKAASETKDFVLATHAAFSYGRVLETAGKYSEACEAYQKLCDEHSSDSWADLAKTRIISLKAEGKVSE